MNNSIQQEIAAPQDCKKNLWLISIVIVNFLVLGTAFILLILKNNSTFDNKYITASLFVSIIVALAIIAAVLLRKHHTLMLTVLSFAAIDAAALLIYHYAVTGKNSAELIWRILTLILSFSVLIFTLLFIGIYFSKPQKRNPSALSITKYLTYCAMFTALTVICKMIGNAVSNAIPVAGATLKFTFVYIPWVIGGIVLGPIGGFAAAAIGDFLGQLAVNTGGLPLPGLIISNGLFAVMPALIFKLLQLKNTDYRSWIAIIIGTILSIFICTLGISTYTLYTTIYTGQDTFFAYLITRLPQSIIVVVNIILMLALSPAMVRAKIIRQPATFFFD